MSTTCSARAGKRRLADGAWCNRMTLVAGTADTSFVISPLV